jgi:hypothetical protein
LGWKQFIRQVEAAGRRHEREARASVRRSERQAVARHRWQVQQERESHRAMVQQQKQWAQQQKELARQEAADEAEEYDNYLKVLVSVHTDSNSPWNWRAISAAPPPAEPARESRAEAIARQALAAHAPGFFAKLFGGASKQRSMLEAEIHHAIAIDQQHYEAAMVEQQQRFKQWNYQAKLAPAVLAMNLDACRSALRYVGAFDELEGFGNRVTLDSVVQNAAMFICLIEDQEIVPTEEIKLTAGGKLSTKDMPAGKYWALYQDHVASCAIRVAREAYAITPIERVIVNMKVVRLNSSTGHVEEATILAVHFTRDALLRLNFAAIDPSEALKNFPHRMKFKKTTGFDPVDDMTADEQWITT